MFGLGILKGTIIGVGIDILASFAFKEACNKSTRNKKNLVGSLKNNRNLSFHRWTIDYLDDLKFVKKVYKEFNYKNTFKMVDILKLLKKKPEIMNINYHIKKKQNLL